MYYIDLDLVRTQAGSEVNPQPRQNKTNSRGNSLETAATRGDQAGASVFISDLYLLPTVPTQPVIDRASWSVYTYNNDNDNDNFI
eukprot:COSAG02_NODE_28081_length_596_cov_2.076459_1_plen_85_part_00